MYVGHRYLSARHLLYPVVVVRSFRNFQQLKFFCLLLQPSCCRATSIDHQQSRGSSLTRRLVIGIVAVGQQDTYTKAEEFKKDVQGQEG